MSTLEFVSSLASSFAWPLAVVVIAVLFREPLTDALRSSRGAVSAGPFKLEWERRAAEVEADLGLPLSISRGQIGGAAGRLDELAEVSPVGAIVESFGGIERTLRGLLQPKGVDGLDRQWSARRLAEMALEQGLITAGVKEAIDGLSVMRNLAAHGGQDEISSQRAHEFVALSQAVLYAIAAGQGPGTGGASPAPR